MAPILAIAALCSSARAELVLQGSLDEVVAAAAEHGISVPMKVIPSQDPAANRKSARWKFDIRIADELPDWFVSSMIAVAATTAGYCVSTPSRATDDDCLPALWIELEQRDVPKDDLRALLGVRDDDTAAIELGFSGGGGDLDMNVRIGDRPLSLDTKRRGRRFQLVATVGGDA